VLNRVNIALTCHGHNHITVVLGVLIVLDLVLVLLPFGHSRSDLLLRRLLIRHLGYFGLALVHILIGRENQVEKHTFTVIVAVFSSRYALLLYLLMVMYAALIFSCQIVEGIRVGALLVLTHCFSDEFSILLQDRILNFGSSHHILLCRIVSSVFI